MGKVYTFRDIMKALCSQSEYHIFTREILDKHSQPNRLDEHSKQKKNNRLSCFDAEAQIINRSVRKIPTIHSGKDF